LRVAPRADWIGVQAFAPSQQQTLKRRMHDDQERLGLERIYSQ
jgi:hypothetical protein